MYTANTMASAIEALGMSLPNSSAQDAISPAKQNDCERAGEAILKLIGQDIKPSDIMTPAAFDNAIKVVIALGGSTNAVLHLLGMAHSMGVKLELDDFGRIGRRVPVLADLRPSGNHLMSELIAIGGIQPLMKRMLDAGMLDGACLTVTGRTLAENLAEVEDYPAGQSIVRELDNPIKPDSHLVILRGNLAPEGAVAKLTGKEGSRFSGRARVFDSEEASLKGILAREIVKGDVIVIRYEGPRGAPGMREMLSPTSAIMGPGAWRRRGADHRRQILRRLAWLRGGAYHAGSDQWRPDRDRQERRPDHDRRREPKLEPRSWGSRNRRAARAMAPTRAALYPRRSGQIRSHGSISLGGRGNRPGFPGSAAWSARLTTHCPPRAAQSGANGGSEQAGCGFHAWRGR